MQSVGLRAMEGSSIGRSENILKPVSSPVYAYLKKMIMEFLRFRPKCKEFFQEPIDAEKLRIPQYYDIITQPRHLQLILDNLEKDTTKVREKKTYRYLEDVANDLRLVWKNAMVFNRDPTHHVFKLAKKFALDMDSNIAKYTAILEGSKKPEPQDSKTASGDKTDQQAQICRLKDRAQLFLSELLQNPFTEWFRRDDWRSIPGYDKAIKSGKPMDLNQVQANLDNGQYDAVAGFNFAAFKADVMLVWTNAIDFNRLDGRSDLFGEAAKIVQKLCETRFEDIQQAPPPPALGEPLAERDGWPTFEEKASLYHHCSRLDPAKATMLAEDIKKRCSDGSEAVMVDKKKSKIFHGEMVATVNIDAIDRETFDAIVKKISGN